MKKLVYLNNFPREGALLWDSFDGSADLKEELLERGIIGEVEAVKEVKAGKADEKSVALQAENEKLQADLDELKDKVKSIDETLNKTQLLEAVVAVKQSIEE